MLKTAPVSSLRLVTGKFLVAYLPTLALSWIFLLLISLLNRRHGLLTEVNGLIGKFTSIILISSAIINVHSVRVEIVSGDGVRALI
ncbi:MAG: hypothetical protein JRF72_15520 [Deltaproteobacteria bacterium]|nr:hypothetical protein [Deltaproteobacteria bacterium]